MSGDKFKFMDSVTSDLISVVGEEITLTTWEDLESKQQKQIQTGLRSSVPPSCVVYPRTQKQLAKVIAQAECQNWRVLICGCGTKISWGGLVKSANLVVSTERINKLIEHAVGDFTVTVEAGMKFSELQAILATANQFLALDPTKPQTATIGGIVATANTGSFRQGYGSVRDQLLGISFVRADGEIVKAGGRVVKNVAGYDLMKLFTGSYGTLGIITSISFRVYPIQQVSATVILLGNVDRIFEASTILRGSTLTPTQADLFSAQLVSDLDLGKGLALIVRFQSISESVVEQSNKLLDIATKLGLQGIKFSDYEEINLWERLQKQMCFTSKHLPIICKIGVLPNTAVKILESVHRGLIHSSNGLGILYLENEGEISEVRNICHSSGGFLSVLQAPASVKSKIDVWGYTGNAIELIQGIKKQFDRKNILNPGRFVSGI